MIVETEICAASAEVLKRLGFKDFTIRLNHRQVLNGLLATAGVETEKHADALVALDKMDKVGPEGVARELIERGIVDESAVKLMRFFEGLAGAKRAAEFIDTDDNVSSYNTDVLGRLVEFIGPHEEGARGVDELRQIVQLAKASRIDQHLRLDPTLARGLSYYTGAIMEINVKDLQGSLGGGGRYDNLVGMFLGKDVPACGFSLGLERIIVMMSERGMFPSELARSPADVMITIWDSESITDAVAIATELRDGGLKVDVYPEADKIGKQLKYASAVGVAFVVVVGDEERAGGEVAVKDLKTGEQQTIKRDELSELIRRLVEFLKEARAV